MMGKVDFTWLPESMQAELTELSARLGSPVTSSADLGDSSYLRRVVERRLAEVCMVVRRPSGRLLVFRKPFYPAGIFRLLTGGVEPEESILDALLREVNEETGLTTHVERFLAASAYLGDDRPQFASFAFLLEERSGTLGALDQDEQVEAFREVEPAHLLEIAEQLEQLPNERNDVLDNNIHEWGLLRALNHRLVWQALYESG
jgi:ADP-ribose pyrophosphatase YjhB (NUDIX family)